jgi:hypothetical protein
VSGATAACGADPAPPAIVAGPASGGATASAGTSQVFPSSPPLASSSGGVSEPAPSPAAGGSPAHAGGTAAHHASGGVAGSASSAVDFEQRCHAGASDECAHCVCRECAVEAEACELRDGCSAIAACVLQTGCIGTACFCGTADALRCLSGAADGPCKDVILSAPGGRSPTLDNTSAGPAADAAVALGACTEPPSGVCAPECS